MRKNKNVQENVQFLKIFLTYGIHFFKFFIIIKIKINYFRQEILVILIVNLSYLIIFIH